MADKRSNKKTNKIKENKTKNVNGKSKKIKFKDKHPKVLLAIKILIIIILLLCVIGAGVLVGIFFGLFGNDFEISKDELMISASNSVVVDQDGNVIADLSGDEKRKIISISEMPEYLPKAYVAIEDERFYNHSGVDIKRTGAAILNFVVKRDSSFGGSTITQQLVKNITQEDEDTGLAGIARKVKEWAKAAQVERMISKNQILELYLNILFVGGQNIHGVELGAEYYFNKSAKDLDLAECAFLAGINHSPNMYNPYSEKDHSEKIKTRTLTVLQKMKELGYIKSEEEYNTAVAKVKEGLKFEKSASQGNIYSYHTDAVISQVINQVAEEKGISKELAQNYVYSSGLTIYSTVDTNVQSRLEEEFAKETYVRSGKVKNADGTLLNEQTQAAMVVIDNNTGYVVGVAGGLGEKTESRGFNRGTQMLKQTGSSMKPLADIVPGLQENIITAGTVYNDQKTEFNNGKYTPKNYNHFRGYITVREFIKTSQNIPAVKIMAELTPAKSIEYLKKMGISSLDDEKDNVLSLAIGGLTNGISPLEMAAAYETIANDGEYVSPTFYTKVTDSEGKVVLESAQTKTRVMSEQNAYIAKSIVQEPVKSGGTATYCAISGMDVAAKTGTTNGDYDRWLCGFTPYYTAATWYGYDNNESVTGWGGTNPAGRLWDNVMTDIHQGLEGQRFTRPSGIVEATICKDTGMKATDKCKNKYTEIFVNGTVPSSCDGHSGSYEICKETGKLANEYCPEKETIYQKINPPKERLSLWKTAGTSEGNKPTDVCDVHKKPEDKKQEEEKDRDKVDRNKDDKDNTTNSANKNNTTNSTTNNTTKNNTTKNNTTNNTNKNNTTKNNTTGKNNTTKNNTTTDTTN